MIFPIKSGKQRNQQICGETERDPKMKCALDVVGRWTRRPARPRNCVIADSGWTPATPIEHLLLPPAVYRTLDQQLTSLTIVTISQVATKRTKWSGSSQPLDSSYLKTITDFHLAPYTGLGNTSIHTLRTHLSRWSDWLRPHRFGAQHRSRSDCGSFGMLCYAMPLLYHSFFCSKPRLPPPPPPPPAWIVAHR